MIPFNKPTHLGVESNYINEALNSNHLSGDGNFTKKCQLWFDKNLDCKKSLLTPSCTQALEMAAILIDIKLGDEVIMPSYTFVSTANAFVLRGAKIVFVDIRADTLNIDENLIEKAITNNTKAIVVVHYAGVSCNMSAVMQIAEKYNIYVIEDAAQAMQSKYKNQPLGTMGHLGTYSFHETKNYTSGGEGGLLIINDEQFVERAEIIREKGTNRKNFFKGLVDKYTWVDIGSSYLASELQAAYLYAQLQYVDVIFQMRLKKWKFYYKALKKLEDKNYITLPKIPKECSHNGHLFYIKLKNEYMRNDLLKYLLKNNIYAVFHYIPLHTSNFGRNYKYLYNYDDVSLYESLRLLRLPLYHSLTESEQNYIINHIYNYFGYSK